MNGLEIAALVAATIWLSVLTLLFLVLVRQVGLVTAWARRSASAATIGDDGIEIGVDVPAPAVEVAPQLEDEFAYLLFLAGNCQPCREFADDAGNSEEVAQIQNSARVVATVQGGGAQADEVARMLPGWMDVVQEPGAAKIAKSFEVQATPMIYEVSGGKVTGRAIAGYGIADLLNLVRAREKTNSNDAADSNGAEAAIVRTLEVDRGGV